MDQSGPFGQFLQLCLQGVRPLEALSLWASLLVAMMSPRCLRNCSWLPQCKILVGFAKRLNLQNPFPADSVEKHRVAGTENKGLNVVRGESCINQAVECCRGTRPSQTAKWGPF